MSSRVWRTKKGPYGNALRSSRTGKPIRYQMQPDKSVLPHGPMQVAITPRANRREYVYTQQLENKTGADIVAEVKKIRDGWKLERALDEIELCLTKIENGSIYEQLLYRTKLRDKYPGAYQILERVEGQEGWEME